MDAETQRWAWGLAVSVGLLLAGAIYRDLKKEDSRLAKNIHDLRSFANHMLLELGAKVDRLLGKVEALDDRVERLERDKDERK